MAPRVHEFPTVKLRRGSPDACQDQVWRGSSKIITFCFGAGPAGGAGDIRSALRRRRRALGLTQEQAAQLLGCPPARSWITRCPVPTICAQQQRIAWTITAIAPPRLPPDRDRRAPHPVCRAGRDLRGVRVPDRGPGAPPSARRRLRHHRQGARPSARRRLRHHRQGHPRTLPTSSRKVCKRQNRAPRRLRRGTSGLRT